MIATVVRIGNSNGIVIPSKLMKSLTLSERDLVEIRECNGGLFLKKAGPVCATTPFTALDRWNEENGVTEEFSLESSLEYVESLRKNRKNKDIQGW